MRKHHRVFITFFVSLFIVTTLIGCGTKRRRGLYNFSPGNNSVISGLTDNLPTTQNAILRIEANPGATVIIGQTISLFATYGNETRFDFSFVGTPPQGVSMPTNRLGVSRVEINGTQSTPVFEVQVNPSGYASQAQSIQLQFIEDPNSNLPLYSPCNIQGPFAYSGENIPRVGSASIFAVSGQNNEFARVTRVWTQDPTETASYYYSENNFYLVFKSAGTKTIYFEAEVNSYTNSWYRAPSTCSGQTTVQVAPRQVYELRDSCGINYVPYNSYEYTCLAAGWRRTYYVYNNACVAVDSPLCSTGNYYRGAFDDLAACEASLSNRSCGNQASDVTSTHTATIEARTSNWTDTGITVNNKTSLVISASGQIKYTNSRWAYTSPAGLDLSGFQQCKANGAKSFNNMAVIGKIGVNGTPFLVGTYLSRPSSTTGETGNLYLAINDLGCSGDNANSFSAVITKTVHAR